MGNGASANNDLIEAVKDKSADGVTNALGAGAEIDAIVEGRTALHVAVYADLVTMATLLLDKGADMNIAVEGGTPLHDAAERGNDKCVELLLARGVPVDQLNVTTGDTALMWAALAGRDAVIRRLLAAGADRTLKNQANKSALDLATAYGKKGAIELLSA